MKSALLPLLAATLLATSVGAQGSDDCATPTPISGSGLFPFDNTGATTGAEGQTEPLCYAFGTAQVSNDIWFAWTAPSTGTVILRTCGQTTVDTKLAVYGESSCPVGSALACEDDTCGLQSELQIPVFQGATYLVQLGTFPGAPVGTGNLEILYACPQGTLPADPSRVYWLDGPPDGSFWSWKLDDPSFAALGHPNVGGVMFGGAKAVADAFRDSINAAAAAAGCEGSVQATSREQVIWGVPFVFLDLWIAGGEGTLHVGLPWEDPGCVPNVWTAPPGCTINPTIQEVPLLGNDCNGNGRDDVLDVVYGDSPDTNQNLIPDECEAFLAYCFGDGSGTPCPCANHGAPGEGCANSTGLGATLAASGSNSLSAGDLVLQASQLEPSQPGLYFQAQNDVNGGLGVAFGDGLRCAGGSVVRIQIRTASAAGDSSTALDVGAAGGVAPGDVRRYQVWYRNPNSSACGSSFNLTHGLAIVWAP